ncbi:MAG TPA: DUF5719 family protein [Jiangellaceae bacterium]|nr:DUF5719 family protein [Jiangellaceae bacterium]
MKRRASSAAATALMVAAGVAVALGATALVDPPDEVVRAHPEQVEPVVRSTSVCPYIGGEARAASRLGVLPLANVAEPDWTPPTDAAESDSDGPPPVVVRRLAGPDDVPDPLTTVAERGLPVIKKVDGSNPAPYAVQAEGPFAPGVVAEQYMMAQAIDLRGVVSAPCTAPGREHWFVGASATPGHRGRLILTNPYPTAAVVTVSLWDATGQVEVQGIKDISIPPLSQEVLVLDAFVPEAEDVGVRVRASQGRVSAALDYRESDDGEPLGISMIPRAAGPAKSLVVPGVPAHGRRTLVVFAPGESGAIVSLKILGADGPFSPLEHDVVTVPAGGMVRVPLDDAVGDAAAAVALDSDEEITAAVRVEDTGADQRPELAYTAAAVPLPAGPSAVVLSRADATVTSRLLLTGIGEIAGRVSVKVLDADGGVADEQVVDVPVGSTVDVELTPPEGMGWSSTVIEPAAAGTVMAVREITGEDDDGRLVDLMPVVPPTLTVQVPTVVSELPTGLRPAGRTETDS